jgi:hypothetical protein
MKAKTLTFSTRTPAAMAAARKWSQIKEREESGILPSSRRDGNMKSRSLP